MEITFIHAADLHLGRVYTGLRHLPEEIIIRLQDSAYRSLERIVSTAIEHNVDFVLFVGDIFDEKSASLRAQLRFKQQLERLHNEEIAVFISHGNHDPLTEGEATIAWPTFVSVFSSERVTTVPFYKNNQLAATIYGFSYTSSEMLTNKSGEYVKTSDASHHIGMLHGNVDGQADHDPYAPFTVSELREKNFDYWALGHIHKRTTLAHEPLIVYPGNIQGMHQNETGEKGCMLVSLSKRSAETTFIPTADIIWRDLVVSITSLQTVDDLLEQLEAKKIELRASGFDSLVRLHFTGYGDLNETLQSPEKREDLLDYLREGEEKRNPFIWMTSIDVQTTGDWDRNELKTYGNFTGELIHAIDRYTDLDEALEPLTTHQTSRRYLHSFTEKDQFEVIQKAETLLLSELTKERLE